MRTPAPGPATENRLHETAPQDRPRERFRAAGAAALSDTELLALLLGSGTRGRDVLTLAARLIAEAGSLAGLTAWQEADFRRTKGIGGVKAARLMAAIEIARRVIGGPAASSPLLTRPDLVAIHFRSTVMGLEVEKLWVLCLNRRHRLIKSVEVTSGTATTTLAHPREVFRVAIRESAAGIVCVHNHPSGDPSPSAADLQITRQLREAAGAVEIALLDHVILGRPEADPRAQGYYSFHDAGLI